MTPNKNPEAYYDGLSSDTPDTPVVVEDDSTTVVPETPLVTVDEVSTSKVTESEVLKTILEQNKMLKEQIQKMNEKLEEVSKRKGPDDDIDYDPNDLERKSPEGCYLRCYNGSPIVKTKMEYDEEVDRFGNVHQAGAYINIETLDGQKTKIPYGSNFSNDYLNLEKKYFAFLNPVDETGASRVERDVVVEKGQIVTRRDPFNQVYIDGVLQGGQGRVQQVVRKDIRYYTILVDGTEHVIHEDVLSK